MGHLRRLRGDGGAHEAGAVGLALGDGEEAGAGTGDLAVAVVAGAGALLKDGTQGQGGEGQDDGDLHLDGFGGFVMKQKGVIHTSID